jgi:hypothetical protein
MSLVTTPGLGALRHRKEERLDWMYASGLQAKEDAEKRREDMLTGKTEIVVAPEQRPEETSRVRAPGLTGY